jgi:hypothetical protein
MMRIEIGIGMDMDMDMDMGRQRQINRYYSTTRVRIMSKNMGIIFVMA